MNKSVWHMREICFPYFCAVRNCKSIVSTQFEILAMKNWLILGLKYQIAFKSFIHFLLSKLYDFKEVHIHVEWGDKGREMNPFLFELIFSFRLSWSFFCSIKLNSFYRFSILHFIQSFEYVTILNIVTKKSCADALKLPDSCHCYTLWSSWYTFQDVSVLLFSFSCLLLFWSWWRKLKE